MPRPLYTPAYKVNQTKTLKDLRASDPLIEAACKDFSDSARAGHLIEPDKWSQHAAYKLGATSYGFGKLGPFRRPAAALREPILHIHVLEVSRILGKHQHHATSDACIVYADFEVHGKRTILMIDYGSSHNGNMAEDVVEHYIEVLHKLRPQIIATIKAELGIE